MGITNTPFEDSRLPKQLFGFDVLDYIGEGAGSVLYVVSHPATKQLYALKRVLPKTAKDQRFVEQLQNEFEVGRQVSHPGLRRSVEVFLSRNLLRKVTEAGLLLELFDGRPLDATVPHSAAGVAEVFVQVAAALDALHHHGFVHCDLKPNNILLDADQMVKIIDLGQTCKIGTAKERIQGTPDFIAPEQVKCEPCTVRTDVYNLGATLYWALTGKKMPTLFTIKKGENSFLLDDRIPTPHELRPSVPENLSDLVMDCVRVNAMKRPENMAEVTRRLELALYTMRKKPRNIDLPDPSDSGSFHGQAVGVGV